MLVALLEDLLGGPLPTGFPATSVEVGATCLGAQILFYLLFAFVAPPGPWKDSPGFTAHQCVVLPLISYIAYVGLTAWLATPLAPDYATPADRAVRLHDAGTHITQIMLGQLVIWDTPTGFAVKALRNTEMLVHHVLFAVVSYLSLANGVMSYYAVCFFGMIEVSSVPLAWVDVCHPRQKSWCAFADRHPAMGALNLVARGVFVLCYFVFRVGVFPYYMFVCPQSVLRDIAVLLAMEKPPVPSYALVGIAATGIPLTLLQFYWAVLLVRQIRKMLSGDDGKEPNAKKSK